MSADTLRSEGPGGSYLLCDFHPVELEDENIDEKTGQQDDADEQSQPHTCGGS